MVGHPPECVAAVRSTILATANRLGDLFRITGIFCMWCGSIVLVGLPVMNARCEELLTLVKRIDLPGVNGRIDHMAFDAETHRLYVAALGNNSVEVIDLDRGMVIKSLGDFAEPQGVLLLADKHELIVTNGESRHVDVYDTRSLQRVRQIALKEDNDNIRYDDKTKLAYIGCGAGNDSALCVFDTTQHVKVQEIALSGHPESFQLEQAGVRIFVNVPTSGSVEVIDRTKGKVEAIWPISAKKNFPMALDEKHRRLFIGTRDPAKLLVLDTETGKTIASLDNVGDVDDIFYIPDNGNIYVSGGEGFIYIFQQQDADRYVLRSQTPTVKGARTSLYVPLKQQLILAVPSNKNEPAQVWVMTSTGKQ